MEKNKDLTIEQYYAKKERREKIGKIFVWTIAIITIISALANLLILTNSALDLAVIFACFVASIVLLCGFSWARIFLAILSAWNAFWRLFTLLVIFPLDVFTGDTITTAETVIIVMYSINFLWYLFCALTLFLHKGVKDYMYGARNG